MRIKRCPNCGQEFEIDQHHHAESGDSNGNIRNGHNGVSEKGLTPVNSRAGEHTGDSYIDSNYFRLLGSSSNSDYADGTTPIEDEEVDPIEYEHNLPRSLFTQGYFDKFFKTQELLGRGARGSVYKVEHILNGISLGHFALKKITIGDDSKWLLKVLREVTMLCKISFNNRNLVNYNHVWLEVSSINDFGPEVPCAFILQQYCSGGNLEDFITNLAHPVLKPSELKKWKLKNKHAELKGRLLTNDEILLIFEQIVEAVAELHKNHIIHRDLKPSNCLLSKPYIKDFTNLKHIPDLSTVPTILVSDFGESQLEGEKRTATGSTGTLEYTAPELLEIGGPNRIPQFNKKTDIYSLGMILFFMSFGKLPYEHTAEEFDILKHEIEDGDVNMETLVNLREDLLPEIKYLIIKMTSKSIQERLSTEEILAVIRKLHSVDDRSDKDLEALAKQFEKMPMMVKRLSLTDGLEIETRLDILKRYQNRIYLTLFNFILLRLIIQYHLISYIFIFFLGLTITHDIKHIYILTTIMFITSIILTIISYLT